MTDDQANAIITIAAKVLVSTLVITLGLGCWKWIELIVMAVRWLR